MSRLPLVDPAEATGRTRSLLDAVEKKLGVIPNMTRALAHSPAALDAYLAFSGALTKTALPAKTRERIALAVGEVNGCDYCLSAHTALGRGAGLGAEEVLEARRGRAADEKTSAILRLARELVLRRGELRDEDLRVARSAGVTDAEIAETVAVTALNVFTNWFNHVARTPIDFPEVHAGDLEPAPSAEAAG